jgi:hypothetical protein
MRNIVGQIIVVVSMSATLVAGQALAGDAKWVCTKDGSELTVKGSKAAEKKKDCEHQGGTWEKAKAKSEQAAPAADQSHGGGGSW